MIALTANSHEIRFRLDSAHTTNPVRAFFTGRNISATTLNPINLGVNSNGITNVTLVTSPSVSEQKEILMASFFNSDTTNKGIFVEYFDGVNAFTLFQCVLAPNEKLEYKDGWRVFSTTGSIKHSINQGANASTSTNTVVVLGSDVTNNNAVANTIQDVTGLSAPLLAGKLYWFKFVIYYTAAATTTGSRWAVSCTAGTAANLSMVSEYSLTTTTTTRNSLIQAFDSPAASNASSAATGNNMCIMEGYFKPTADGTFIARFASEIASSAIIAKSGSVLFLRQTN